MASLCQIGARRADGANCGLGERIRSEMSPQDASEAGDRLLQSEDLLQLLQRLGPVGLERLPDLRVSSKRDPRRADMVSSRALANRAWYAAYRRVTS